MKSRVSSRQMIKGIPERIPAKTSKKQQQGSGHDQHARACERAQVAFTTPPTQHKHQKKRRRRGRPTDPILRREVPILRSRRRGRRRLNSRKERERERGKEREEGRKGHEEMKVVTKEEEEEGKEESMKGHLLHFFFSLSPSSSPFSL